MVYSSNARTREQVRLALGDRIHPELPELTYTEVATGPMVITLMDAGGFDLVILDGEAAPVGGMGLAKQLKDKSFFDLFAYDSQRQGGGWHCTAW